MATYGPVCVLQACFLQMTEKTVETLINEQTGRKVGIKLIHWQNIKNDPSLRYLYYREG
jgi:hypothetical protein